MTDASRVIATDDQAALSKASCVRLGYWEDEALLKVSCRLTIRVLIDSDRQIFNLDESIFSCKFRPVVNMPLACDSH